MCQVQSEQSNYLKSPSFKQSNYTIWSSFKNPILKNTLKQNPKHLQLCSKEHTMTQLLGSHKALSKSHKLKNEGEKFQLIDKQLR